jgi:hypothetical protein
MGRGDTGMKYRNQEEHACLCALPEHERSSAVIALFHCYCDVSVITLFHCPIRFDKGPLRSREADRLTLKNTDPPRLATAADRCSAVLP